MARSIRISPAGVPLHIVQRGNNRQSVFTRKRDYEQYLKHLEETAEAYHVAVHAYVLMGNHIHLLVTPATDNSISGMMQALGRRYVRYFNDTHDRTGGLFEGRYRSCLVESDRYLLACYRYIESNPVRAGMVDDPADYPWSSYHHNALAEPTTIITPHGEYLGLAQSAEDVPASYRKLFARPLKERDLKEMRSALQSSRAYGSDKFKRAIEGKLKVRMMPGKPGRPRLHPKSEPESASGSDGDSKQQQSLL